MQRKGSPRRGPVQQPRDERYGRSPQPISKATSRLPSGQYHTWLSVHRRGGGSGTKRRVARSRTTTPSAPKVRLRDIFLMSRPPLLARRGDGHPEPNVLLPPFPSHPFCFTPFQQRSDSRLHGRFVHTPAPGVRTRSSLSHVGCTH